ncbi:pre-mRNA-splicing factor SYF1-like [Apteryx rowi]|uniref:pre-mRNA-splicing factor SYF1-like n=1 Tax=Apteryx rowi TaxID=308060 RepID=UPI000E1D59B9|nr:pre-mRNA-splicing factor SYF1-like [Apteryx rowi]
MPPAEHPWVPAAIYLLYAKLEEDFGLARHAMAVYERATRAVLPTEQYDMFNIYIKRAAEIYGVTHTRPIYEKAIEVLADEHAREMCLRFADMECKLGEIDRARAIYGYCSQICDPRVSPRRRVPRPGRAAGVTGPRHADGDVGDGGGWAVRVPRATPVCPRG